MSLLSIKLNVKVGVFESLYIIPSLAKILVDEYFPVGSNKSSCLLTPTPVLAMALDFRIDVNSVKGKLL